MSRSKKTLSPVKPGRRVRDKIRPCNLLLGDLVDYKNLDANIGLYRIYTISREIALFFFSKELRAINPVVSIDSK